MALGVGFSMLHWLVYGTTVGKSKDFVPDDALALARTCAGHLWNSHAPCFGRCGVWFSCFASELGLADENPILRSAKQRSKKIKQKAG